MLSLYPAIEPFHHYHLTVTNDESSKKDSSIEHQLYVEQCGNPAGIPVVFLHGGPGSGCRATHRCFFDPDLYHIILFDQRGCGRSRPYGALAHNTTKNLVQDIEAIRQHIGIDKWLVFGGSWGATLGLYYAQHFSQHVTGLILRGVFLARTQDIDWVYSENGAAKIFPDVWAHLVRNLPLSQQDEPLSIIYQQLTSNNIQVSNDIFRKLTYWEENLIYWQDLMNLKEDPVREEDKIASIIQLYYSINKCFIGDEPLLDNIKSIQHIPIKIIHGRYDMVCPLTQAWLVKKHLPKAELSIIEMAGHVANETKIIDALITATISFANQFSLNKDVNTGL